VVSEEESVEASEEDSTAVAVSVAEVSALTRTASALGLTIIINQHTKRTTRVREVLGHQEAASRETEAWAALAPEVPILNFPPSPTR